MDIGKEFILLFAVLFLPGFIVQGGTVDPRSFEHLSYHLTLLAVAVPQFLLVIYVCDLRRPGSRLRLGWTPPSWKDAATAVVGYAGAVSLSAFVVSAGSLFAEGGERLSSAVTWTFTNRSLLPVALLSTLAIGYREEVFYRAYVLDRALEAGVRPLVALPLAALLFAAGHLYEGLAGAAVALVVGLYLSGVYACTRSLHGVAIAHGAYNLTVLLAAGAIAPPP